MAQKHDTPEYVDAPMTRAGTLELVASRRQIRSDAFTAARWAAVNPILQLGEIGYETDTNKLKVGDGVTEWNDLGYVGGGSSLPDQDGHAGEFLTTDGTDASWATVDALPDQTGHSGEFLTTDGTDASWGAVSEVPSTTGATEGDVLTVDSNGDPAWTTPSGGGLPDQTGQSGKFLTTDGTDASWGTISALVNETTGQNSLSILGSNRPSSSNMVAVGKFSGANSASYTTLIGYSATSRSNYGTAIGSSAAVGLNANYAIQLGASGTNSDANTFKVANQNGNFEIMSADGTIPAARHASLPATDGTYVLKLVIASGVPTLSWVAE